MVPRATRGAFYMSSENPLERAVAMTALNEAGAFSLFGFELRSRQEPELRGNLSTVGKLVKGRQ